MELSHSLLAIQRPSGLHPTPNTATLWPRNTFGGASPPMSHTVTDAFDPPLTNFVPSGLQSRSYCAAAKPRMTCTHFALEVSHTRSVPSSPVLTRLWEPGLLPGVKTR